MSKMKRLFRSYWYLGAGILGALVIWVGCTPEKGGALGPLPKASFSILGGGDSNSVTVVNKAPGTIAYWSAPGKGNQSGDSAHFRFTFAGTYAITETVVGHGGLDTVTQMVTINQNDPTACTTTLQGIIAGCTSKTWKLDPIAGAEGVGPGPNDVSWWGNGAAEPAGDRICDWNDTWTFAFDAAGTLTYNNQGDFYPDGYIGNAGNTCDVNADLSATQAPWFSQNQHYTVSETGGVKNLGQLTVVGLGAHIGLPKVTNGAQNTVGPVNSITYDVYSITHDPAGFDVMVLVINDGIWWTFTLRSY